MARGVVRVEGSPASPLAARRKIHTGEAGSLEVLWTVESHGVACNPREAGGRSPRAEGGGLRGGGGGGKGAVGRAGAWRAVGFAVQGGGEAIAADTCLSAL